MSGTSAARHILFTCLLASIVSNLAPSLVCGVSTKVIECIKHDIKSLEEGEIEFRVLDICMTRLKLDIRIELLRHLLRDLRLSPPSLEPSEVIPAPLIS